MNEAKCIKCFEYLRVKRSIRTSLFTFHHVCMQLVSLNPSVDEVKFWESTSVQGSVTESPPTPLPNQHKDGKTVGEVSRAAANQDPEVSVTILISQA